MVLGVRYVFIDCIVLYCIVLYCIVLYCIVLYCIVLYCIVLYCISNSTGAVDPVTGITTIHISNKTTRP